MITYRMDGCTLGFAQNPGAPAYVSHHNDKAGSNAPATLTAQNITWNPTAAPAIAPALNFMHKDTYMSDSTNSINAQYKATVFGVRGAHGTWDFYYQARKRQGTLADAKWTLKGVTQI